MRVALEDLQLEQIVVLYPGSTRYSLGPRVTVAPLTAVAEGTDSLFPRLPRRRRLRS
jgi:hypothetical protein